jgi:hypothetical protein
MRLLVTINYVSLLFPATSNYGDIITAIEQAEIVEEEGPYNARVWKLKENPDISIRLIQDSDIRLPGTPRSDTVEKLLELAKERDALRTKVYTLEEKLKAAQQAVGVSV